MKERKKTESESAQGIEGSPDVALEGLSTGQVTLLEALAVIGRPATAELLGTVLSMPAAESVRELGELTSSRILRRSVKRRRRVYSFRDDALGPALYNRMTDRDRGRFHAVAARVLEEEYGPESERHCEELARHFIASGSKTKGVHYGLLAADSLKKKNNDENAVGTYEAVLSLLPESGKKDKKIRALKGLCALMTDLGRHGDALKRLHEILDIGGEQLSKEEQAETWYGIARQFYAQGKFREAEEHALRGIDLAPRRAVALRAGLLSTLALVRSMDRCDSSSLTLCEEALSLAEQSGDKAAIVRVNTVAGGICLWFGDYEKTVKHYNRVLEAGKDLPASRDLIGAYNNIGISCLLIGRPMEAVAWLDKCVAQAKKRGDRPLTALALLNMGCACMESAQYDKALQCLTRAITLYEGMGPTSVLPCAHRLLGMVLARLGQEQQARRELETAVSLYEAQESYSNRAKRLAALAGLAKLGGDGDRTLQYLRDAVQPGTEVRAVIEVHDMLFEMARLLITRADFDEATRVAERLLEVSRKTGYRYYQVRVKWLKAMIAAESGAGNKEDVAAALTEAIESLTDNMAPELVWRAHLRLAHIHLEDGHLEKVLDNLRQAARTISRIRRQVPEQYRRDYMHREGREEVLRELASLERKLGRELPPVRFSLLLDTIKLVNREHDIDKILNRSVEVALELTGAERGYLILVEDGKTDLKAARRADGRPMSKRGLKTSRAIAITVAESGRTILSSDANNDENLRLIIGSLKTPLCSVLCVPLTSASKTLGAMYLDNRYQTDAFTPDDLRLIESFADQATVAIENARLHEELAKLNVRLEKRLQERTHELKTLLAERDSMTERTGFGDLTGRSKAMQDIYHLIEKVADLNLSILIQGESGTGKELAARAIHFTGKRKNKPFIAENCAALPEALLESELFGYVKGAFTGADRDKKGLFELAHGGTLFLDEVGDMSPGMQAKLLRVLQEGRFRPLGGKEMRQVDVRILAASNKDLAALVRDGVFREDLFYRLNVMNMIIPPLRDRKVDIPLLVEALSTDIARREKRKPLKFSVGALRTLMMHDWPGNVRELRNVIEKAYVIASGGRAGETEVRMSLPIAGMGLDSGYSVTGVGFKSACDLFARDYLTRLMREVKGNITQAAAKCKVSRQNLQYFLRKYAIKRPEFTENTHPAVGQ